MPYPRGWEGSKDVREPDRDPLARSPVGERAALSVAPLRPTGTRAGAGAFGALVASAARIGALDGER